MHFVTHYIEAQLHREVYVAILNSLLRTPGDKRAFARRVGISPVYLSYLLALDNDRSRYTTLRTPSPKIAHRIALAVAAPPEVRESLLQHMLLANDKRALARQCERRELQEASWQERLSELRALQVQATYASNPATAQQNYRAVAIGGRALLEHANPNTDLLDFLALCDILCDSESVLNQHAEALWHAKRACAVLEHVDWSSQRAASGELRSHYFNMLRLQGVAYCNLEDGRSALRLFTAAEHLNLSRHEPGWMILLQRGKIQAMSRLPRFAISEAEACANKAHALCSQSTVHAPELFTLLVNQTLAEAHIRHKNFRRTQRLLQAYEHRLDDVPAIGPLHKVLFLRTCADLCLAVGDTGWKRFAHRAYQLAIAAGLVHQRSEIERVLRMVPHDCPLEPAGGVDASTPQT